MRRRLILVWSLAFVAFDIGCALTNNVGWVATALWVAATIQIGLTVWIVQTNRSDDQQKMKSSLHVIDVQTYHVHSWRPISVIDEGRCFMACDCGDTAVKLIEEPQ